MRKLFLVLVLLNAMASYACDCMMTYPVTRHVATSQFILTVKALDVEKEENYPNSGVRAIVSVMEVLKGETAPGNQLVFDAEVPSNCAFRFQKGKEYLVFAYRKGEHYEVYACSFSEERNAAAKHYRKLRRYIRQHGAKA